jgi:hypothetical protein
MLCLPGVRTRSDVRVVVGTAGGLARDDAQFWLAELVVLTDARSTFESDASFALQSESPVDDRRIVGFLDAGQTLSRIDAVRLIDRYGPTEVYVPAYGHEIRSVEYVFVTNSHGPSGDDSDNSAVKKGRLVWRNDRRNRLIAKLVRAFASGNAETVQKRVRNLTSGYVDRPLVVGVVVESPLHGRRLVELLAGPPSPTTDPLGAACSGAVGTDRDSRVLTFDQLAKDADALSRLDVLVRADGGTGMLPMRPNTLVVPAGATRPLLVVDFGDEVDPWLAARGRGRRQAYRDAGWARHGDRFPTPELDRYLRLHPMGRAIRRRIDEVRRRARMGGVR